MRRVNCATSPQLLLGRSLDSITSRYIPLIAQLQHNSTATSDGTRPTKCRVLTNPSFYQGSAMFSWSGNRLLKKRPVLHRSFSAMCMPSGYPQSCAPGYARYFYLYVLHAFISNFSMSIATQALLGGFFAESTPQIWMLKDLAPSIVAAYFANRVASYESRPKYWLLVAVALSQGASVLDLLIPCFLGPEHLLGAAIVSAVIKSNAVLMHFVARASVLQHFAIYQNLGEIQKKLNSAGMINFPIATALGIGFSTLFPSFAVQATAVGFCSVAAVALVRMSVSHVAFRSITPLTGQIVIEKFIASNYTQVETLEVAEQRLGASAKLANNSYIEGRFAVNPSLSTLNLTKDDTLLFGSSLDFTVGLWETKSTSVTSKVKRRFFTSTNSPAPHRLVLLVHRNCQPRQLYLAHLLCYAALSQAKGATSSDEKWQADIRAFFRSNLATSFSAAASLSASLDEAKVNLSVANSNTRLLNQTSSELASPDDSDISVDAPPLVKLWAYRTAALTSALREKGWDVDTPFLDDFGRRIALEPSE